MKERKERKRGERGKRDIRREGEREISVRLRESHSIAVLTHRLILVWFYRYGKRVAEMKEWYIQAVQLA